MYINRDMVEISSEPVSSIRYKMACATSEDSNQSVHPHSLISLIVPPVETLTP